MLKSQAFLKRGKKIIQEEGLPEARQVAGIRDLFLTFLGREYYESSARDLFDWEISYVLEKRESLYTLLDRLGNILDFLSSDCQDLSFHTEEASLLVALVEESAGEIPIKDLTTLMQTLIAKRLL